jgi:hypothetical protein
MGGVAGGPPGGAAGAGGSGGSGVTCAQIAAEYASSFAEQVTCNPGAGNQCQDRIEAAPGCDCRLFIEPKDPFAIEDLLNVYAAWLDANCQDPMCPSSCPSGMNGVCGSNGRCTEAP